MPARDRERINRALNDLKTDPLSGDITALRGAYRGLYRHRVGSWRIIFGLERKTALCWSAAPYAGLRQLIEIAGSLEFAGSPPIQVRSAESQPRTMRPETGASHALAVLIRDR